MAKTLADRISVKREPTIYGHTSGDSPHSFFRDLVRSSRRDSDAATRLERHALETRVNPNTTATTGGEFAPPLWAIDQFATQARAGRVLADLVTNLLLPPNVSSIHIPRATTGGDAAIQAAQGAPVQSVDQVTADAGSNTDVVTITGDVDASLQLLDQTPAPGYDGIVWADLSRAYNQTLERQMISGTGLNGQMTGVSNLTGRNTDVSGAGATTIAAVRPLIGQASAAIGNNRFLPTEFILMAPRRWEWIASSVDTSSRPLASPGPAAQISAYPAVGDGNVTPFTIQGHPAYPNGALNGATATVADNVISLRASDMLLYESAPRFVVLPNPLSGTLQVRIQLRKYVCFPVMQTKSICVVTALPQPASF